MANRADATFIRVIGSELVQRYVGEGEQLPAHTSPSLSLFLAPPLFLYLALLVLLLTSDHAAH